MKNFSGLLGSGADSNSEGVADSNRRRATVKTGHPRKKTGIYPIGRPDSARFTLRVGIECPDRLVLNLLGQLFHRGMDVALRNIELKGARHRPSPGRTRVG